MGRIGMEEEVRVGEHDWGEALEVALEVEIHDLRDGIHASEGVCER